MRHEGPQPESLDDSRVIDEVERYRHVATCDRRAARADLLAKFPQLAEDLNDCLDGLDLLTGWPGTESLEGSEAEFTAPSHQSLGDFRIVRELGRGGMAVVYEAEQLSLGRRVALKVLPFAAFLDPRRLQRFKQEAQAAAMLRHPNIVSVFCVGCERGVHYYAMELVEGCSIADLVSSLATNCPSSTPDHHASNSSMCREADTRPIASLSTEHENEPAKYHRSVTRLGATLAEALQYAHEQGVVHRDVKPSNLLLDPRGRPWITDFGLAQIADDRGLTMSGDLLGTLRYMSPEQAAGKKILDHRTDIYSLGATLFELLTLHPALDAKDRPELLRQLDQHRPRLARSLDSQIPKDLETILLMAMATRPEDRYESAQEFADDLQRFLNRKPISARRPSQGHRIIRWIQRHPAMSMLLAAMALLVATLAIGGPLVAFNYAELAQREATSRRELQALLADTLTSVTEALENTPHVDEIHRKLLTDTRRQYERLLVHADQTPDIVFQFASGLIRLGAVIDLRFDPIQGADVIEKGVRILEPLARECPERVEYQFQLAEAYFDLGAISLGHDNAQSANSFRSSIDILTKLVTNNPSSPRFHSYLAVSRYYLGRVTGERREAEAIIRLAISDLERLQTEGPSGPHHTVWLADAKDSLSRLLLGVGRLEEATREIREAHKLVQSLPPETRSETRVRIGVARVYGTYAACLRESEQLNEAEAAVRDGLAEANDVLQGFPDSDWARFASIRLSHELARNLALQGRLDEASAAIRLAMERMGYSARFRDRNSHLIAYTRFLFAMICWQQNRDNEAREMLDVILAEPERAGPGLISWIYACSPYADQRDSQNALTYAQRCPDEPAVEREKLLGIANYRLGSLKDARLHLQTAHQLASVTDAETLIFLAMTEHALGDTSSAQATWKHAQEQVDTSHDINLPLLHLLVDEAHRLFGEI